MTLQDVTHLCSQQDSMFDSLRKLPILHDAITGFTANDVWETRAEIPHWWHVSSASDWLKHFFNQSKALKQDLGSDTWSV